MSWHWQITSNYGRITGPATLYHEQLGEALKGHDGIIKQMNDNGFTSYVNPHDGSDAYFDLRKGLHSVKTIPADKLSNQSFNFTTKNIPTSTKSLVLVRWGFKIELPREGNHRRPSFEWEIISVFDNQSGLWL
jgi:hypothetical protein